MERTVLAKLKQTEKWRAYKLVLLVLLKRGLVGG
jgi:hypothetical protein